MSPLLKFITSSGFKKKEPRYACKKRNPQSPQSGSPPIFPNRVPMERDREMLSVQSQWFIHLYLSETPEMELCHEMRGKHIVIVHIVGWVAQSV
jgi:hypothetical protein